VPRGASSLTHFQGRCVFVVWDLRMHRAYSKSPTQV